MIGQHAQGGVFDQRVIGQVQALNKARLWNAVDMRNIGDGHPRPHRRYIAMLDALVILLEVLICLNGACRCKTG